MAHRCLTPIKGFRGPNGRLVPAKGRSLAGAPLEVPCGGCLHCRLNKAGEWATRIMCEAQMHEASVFLTLTIDPEHMRENRSISVEDLQRFVKRLRERLRRDGALIRIRYFGAGEYGDKGSLPHYHIIIFGYDFPDKTFWTERNGFSVYRSALLEEVWPFGFSEVSVLTRKLAGYCARYSMKKINGAASAEHYRWTDPETGEIHEREPEFALMSTKPALGDSFFDAYERDCFPSGFLVVDGCKVSVPKRFKRKLKGRYLNPGSEPYRLIERDDYAPVARKAKEHARRTAHDNTPERLEVKAELTELRVSRLKRGL